MSTPADAITDDLIDKSRRGFDEIGAELAKRWRQMIAVPVSGTGRKKIRSKPGEPPRKEHGTYQKSISHTTTVTADTVRTEAGTHMERGIWLEKGTGRMAARPHASKLAKEFGGEVVTRVREAIADAINS